jgi:hypothetical protein
LRSARWCHTKKSKRFRIRVRVYRAQVSTTLAAPSHRCGLQRVGCAVGEVLVVVAARDGRTLTASAHERKSAVPSTHTRARVRVCVRVLLRIHSLLWQWHGWLRHESVTRAVAPRCMSTAAEHHIGREPPSRYACAQTRSLEGGLRAAGKIRRVSHKFTVLRGTFYACDVRSTRV